MKQALRSYSLTIESNYNIIGGLAGKQHCVLQKGVASYNCLALLNQTEPSTEPSYLRGGLSSFGRCSVNPHSGQFPTNAKEISIP